jgi:DNA helicase-2/ATP-dependent DNA helicase PcrA
VAILTKTDPEWQAEQKHLDKVIGVIKDKSAQLSKSIEKDRGEARNINAHFFDDVKLDYDNYSTSIETALSIRQQQQLLNERQNAWQHSAKELSTLQRLVKRPYFARVDFKDPLEDKPETIYIGLSSFADSDNHFLIYDWRAPISSIYYDGRLGKATYNAPAGQQTVEMTKKRQFEIADGQITNMFDTDESIGDQMLIDVLNEKSAPQMKSIVTTIQREQNKIIRDTSSDLLFVQGAAGSGKTSAILQRVAYLLYRYRGNLHSSEVIMFSPNQLFNDYIENVLPEMGEQNMVQMTYWQFVSRRLPKMHVENLFDQFEHADDHDPIQTFKNSRHFFNLVKRYSQHLNQRGMAFRDIFFQDKKNPFFAKQDIEQIYYSFNQNYNLRNRIDATREELMHQLNRRISTEARKAWVRHYLEGLSQQELTALYDRPDQEFASEKQEERFLTRKIAIGQLKKVAKQIQHNRFLSPWRQYLRFLRAVPKMTDLDKAGISLTDWQAATEQVRADFKQGKIKMTDVSAYLLLYDLATGKRPNYDMRYAFVDEIQDYTPFQLAYLKFNFPRAKFTMLGDLNQAIFTKDNSRTLLSEISDLFDPDKTRVVQLTKSYRSTKQITDFTKQILREGEKIEAFDRQGPLPVLWQADTAQTSLQAVQKALAANDRQHLTTAIITKDVAAARQVFADLKKTGEKLTLIASANQRLVPGNLVVPSYLAKGLEFDAVIMWDASAATYHAEDETQLVYTIASRAMYKLDIIYEHKKSPLLPVKTDSFEQKTIADK